MLFLHVALHKALHVTEIKYNTYNSVNRLPSYLVFGSFQKVASCNLMCWPVRTCVHVGVCREF